MNLHSMFKALCVTAGAFFGYIWGDWGMLLQVLTSVTALDYATGVLASGVQGALSSKVGYKGIAKKLGIFILVAVAHLIDLTIGKGSVTRDAVIFFYIGNELISILENCGRMGLPIPSILQRAVKIFSEKDGE